jgi:hypothetical protein
MTGIGFVAIAATVGAAGAGCARRLIRQQGVFQKGGPYSVAKPQDQNQTKQQK